MSDEIKEILDYLKNDDYSPVFADEGCDDTPYKLFDETEVKLLLDYITNLQEEIHKKDAYIKYLEEYNPKYYKGKKYYGDAREVLQQRIDKAIPMLKELNKKLKDILHIGIDIAEIIDIENTLTGGDKE